MTTLELQPKAARSARALVAPFHDLYPYEHNFLEVDGGHMHYVDEGPRDAAPLLCVHGNPTWSFLFRRQIDSLAGPMRVIAPDHMGCGLSSQPADWSYRLADHVRNLATLIEHLDLRRITLLVHDWGGAIGLGAALRDPGRVARLVITNTAAFPAASMPWRISACRTPLLGRLVVEGLDAFARAATFMAVERPLPKRVRQAFVAPYARPRSARATWHFVDDIPMTSDHPSWGTLSRIAAGLPTFQGTPTLLLWGEKDWCFTPAFRGEWERRLPHAEGVRLEEAGHYLFEDAPDETAQALSAFFAAHPLPPVQPRSAP